MKKSLRYLKLSISKTKFIFSKLPFSKYIIINWFVLHFPTSRNEITVHTVSYTRILETILTLVSSPLHSVYYYARYLPDPLSRSIFFSSLPWVSSVWRASGIYIGPIQSPRKTSDREEREVGIDMPTAPSLLGHCEMAVTFDQRSALM